MSELSVAVVGQGPGGPGTTSLFNDYGLTIILVTAGILAIASLVIAAVAYKKGCPSSAGGGGLIPCAGLAKKGVGAGATTTTGNMSNVSKHSGSERFRKPDRMLSHTITKLAKTITNCNRTRTSCNLQ